MHKNRREFLKLTAVAASSVLPAATLAEDQSAAADFADSYGVLVDTVLCVGCRKCEQACNQANQLCERDPEFFSDREVLTQSRRPDACAYTVVNGFSDPSRPDRKYSMKVQCMHCNLPACVSACIVGALTKEERGPVTYDAWKCIGCRYCMVACPFQVPAYEYENALNPRVMKCTFCYDRFDEAGFRPACVTVCPGGALTFGKREDLIDLAYLRMKRSPDQYYNKLFGEHEIGGTSWMYLASVDLVGSLLPELDDKPIPALTEKIQHGLFKSFVPPLALYGLLGLIMHSLRKDKGEDGDSHEH